MINFRFHLVSLIAVFLALALGVVVGSTVIDQAIVRNLEDRIDVVEKNADKRRDENHRLRAELDRVGAYVDQSAPYLLQGRLEAVTVTVMAMAGTDEGAVRSAVESLRAAGAVVPAVLWLEDPWLLNGSDDRGRLRDVLGVESTSADALRGAAARRLAARLAEGGAPAPLGDEQIAPASETTAPPTSPETDILTALVDARFLSVDTAGGPSPDLAVFPGEGARSAVVSGAVEGTGLQQAFLAVVDALATQGVATVVGEVASGDDTRGAVVHLVRDDGELSKTVSTVDDVELVEGRAALVLALDERGRAKVGHYGRGSGASRLLPDAAAE